MVIRAIWSFNGQEKVILGNWHRLWCLLFGPFYYAFKGMWGTAFLSLITLNGLLILFPLWNRTVVKNYYESMGWREILSMDVVEANTDDT